MKWQSLARILAYSLLVGCCLINGLTLDGVGSGTTLDHIHLKLGAALPVSFYPGSTAANYTIYSYSPDVLISQATSPVGTRGAIAAGTAAGTT